MLALGLNCPEPQFFLRGAANPNDPAVISQFLDKKWADGLRAQHPERDVHLLSGAEMQIMFGKHISSVSRLHFSYANIYLMLSFLPQSY